MIGIFIYSLYIIYDTQLIIGQVGCEYNIDDYCLAALNLYIDIIYLFIKILQLIGGHK
jgi:FtsH-binding integral membrane protein